MSWGVSLWDQFPTLGIHTQKGIDFCEKFAVFVKEWCAMENDYASKIKRLVKSYQPKKKDDPEGEQSFTWMQGFQGVLREMHDIANQHEIVSEELNQQVQVVLINLAKELKENRRKALQEQAKQEASLLQQLQSLDKAKKQYEKSFKDGEKSVENYKRIDADQSFPRIDVEKAKNTMHQRLQQCEACKTGYAAELQKTNDAQSNYYLTTLPSIIQQLQASEEQRIEQTRRLIHQVADIESRVMPILQRCIEGIRQSADGVNERQDTQLMISKLETGYKPPGDLVFDDLGTPGVPDSGSATPGNKDPASASKAARSKSVRSGSISGSGRKSQRGSLLPGLFSGGKVEEPKEDYSHLPPNQQKKKLLAKIDTLSHAIAKDTAERDGMQKMREVYTQNPKLGDPATIDKQLQENAQKLDKLMLERKKYEYFLTEAERRTAEVNGEGSLQDLRRPLSTATNNNGANHEHDATKRYSKPSITSEDSFEDEAVVGNGGGDSVDGSAPVLGTCQARYPFTANSDGSISMADGEELLVVESDQGDGWTLVRRRGVGGEEGFVPTSYIDIYLHR